MDDIGLDDLANAVVPAQRRASPLAVRFYTSPVKDEAKSKTSGRDIFVDTEMIEIRIPGQLDTIRRPVRELDRREHAHLYEAFKASASQEAVEGFPLSEWAGITRAQAEELRYFGIRSVEHLANCPDSALQRVGPLMALRQKARDWLEQAEKGSVANKLRAENDDLRSRLSTLEQMVQRQTQEIEAARSNGGSLPSVPDPRIEQLERLVANMAQQMAPKKRGRPPKKQESQA